jgi:undecaprenyl-diphosphatase
MGTLEALLYGLIQGMTEFLPVSSSGHLALLPKTLGFKDPGVLFDLAMHLGTALAIGLYFRKDIKNLLSSTLRLVLQRKVQSSSDALCANMIIATLITGVLGLLLKELAFAYGRNPSFIAFNLIFFGLLMAWADSFFDAHEQELMNEFRPVRSSLIGLFQVMAIFPGVSRSGATLTISRFLKLSRYEAGRFSFLLSLPLIVAGSIYEFSQLDLKLINFELSNLFFGIVVSFFIGIITIHYFLKWISRIGLWPFSLYRLFLGIIVYWYLT